MSFSFWALNLKGMERLFSGESRCWSCQICGLWNRGCRGRTTKRESPPRTGVVACRLRLACRGTRGRIWRAHLAITDTTGDDMIGCGQSVGYISLDTDVVYAIDQFMVSASMSRSCITLLITRRAAHQR